MENMIVRRLKWYFEYNILLNIKQSGFEERTIDHMLRLHDTVQKSLANNHKLLAVDIEKVYKILNNKIIILEMGSVEIFDFTQIVHFRFESDLVF